MRLLSGMSGKLLTAFLIAALSSACSSGRNAGSSDIDAISRGPDEFAILPNKPLQLPGSYAELPPPGGANRGSANPSEDVIVALGGDPAAVSRGIPNDDAGLVAHAARYGTQEGIRRQLAAEDVEFRRKNDGRLLERWFNANLYFQIYGVQSLDQFAEHERFRSLGVRTPDAPPRTGEDT